MKFVHYTNSLSAHQIPLDRELVKRIGADNFRYIYTNEMLQGGAQEIDVRESWIIDASKTDVTALLEECDILLVGGLRPIDLMERRSAAGKITLYMSERWFKPVEIGVGGRCRWRAGIQILGWVRMLVPRYRRMARRFVRLLRDDPKCWYLPIGPWAKRDMLWLGVPSAKMLDWGDFVELSRVLGVDNRCRMERHSFLRLLYIGRLLRLKHVETVVRSLAVLRSGGLEARLTIVGNGPERDALGRLVKKLGLGDWVEFRSAVKIEEVREVMRQHDFLVFASNAMEGWGCVVQEALTEGVPVVGTYEAGASAAILPETQLFHCGDSRELARKIVALQTAGDVVCALPYDYTPVGGAERLLKLVGSLKV